MRKSNLLGGALLFAALFVNTSCKEIFGNMDLSGDTTVSSYVAINTASKTAAPAEEFTLSITKIGDGTVTWSSSDPAIAEVQGAGLSAKVIAKKSGNATITANVAAAGNYQAGSAKCAVAVRVQNAEQLAKDLETQKDGSEIQIYLADNATIDLSAQESSTKFPVIAEVIGAEGKPATIIMGIKGFQVNDGLTFENVNIDASAVTETLFTLKDSQKKVVKTDGTESEFEAYSGLTLQNMTISGVPSGKNFVKAPNNSKATKYLVDNSVIEIAGGSANIFNLQSGFYDFFIIQNSTLYCTASAGHTGYLIKSDGKPKNLESVNDTYPGTVTTTLDHVTMYQIAKGKQMNNSNGNMKGQKYLTQNLTNCILVHSGSNSSCVKGWLFGQESTSPTLTYQNNTYWNDADFSDSWTSKSCGDKSGTEIKTFDGFKDAAKGDFTITSGVQKEKQTGDPRWVK